MSLKRVEVIVPLDYKKILQNFAEEHEGVIEHYITPAMEDQRNCHYFLLAKTGRQQFLDDLQTRLEKSPTARIIVFDAESTIPKPKSPEQEQTQQSSLAITRENLYEQVSQGADLTATFLLLIFLSSIVAGIGLLENNVAVVIAAMVIAPLLGPNLAFSLGVALGDQQLMIKALRTNLLGIGFTIFLAVVAGALIELDLNSKELLLRTDVGLDGMALALASGVAAVLSLTAGLSSTLVGVMVAVALMPPAVTAGLMLGNGHIDLALGATVLLLVNVVSVNLSAQVVFLVKGIKPRTWLEQRAARQSVTINLAIWTFLLLILFITLFYEFHKQ
ncbi:MAG: TIGR00341 family protein [Magnetococcales bacterium]|nr:TIGR00341 family protein [Magnetococcales bacterium]